MSEAVHGKRVHLISLGCAKNQVDSEVMLGHLARAGAKPAASADEADILIVNTCAFIDAAKEESVDTILEMAELRAQHPGRKLVVTGCLSQRYGSELATEIPEVDHFLGTGNFEAIVETLEGQSLGHPALPVVYDRAAHSRLRGRNRLKPFRHVSDPNKARSVEIPDPDFTLSANSPRLQTGPAYSTYLKISEGCSNTCAFCIIPKLRGAQRSRTIEDLVTELERLIENGAKEVNLVAQDLCAYGKDLPNPTTLAELLRRLDAVASQAPHPVWIRCLYAYPRGLTSEVIETLATARSVVPYLDMPLQHISDRLLTTMRRGKGGAATRALLDRLRKAVPQLALRTTFIAGLPGETEADYRELLDFVAEYRFERVGAFVYSPEEDTPAATMPDQVPREVAERRRDGLLALQRRISIEQQHELVGRTLRVLVEGVSEESELLLQGRHAGQAPEVDGVTYINDGQAAPGDWVDVLVDQALDYDVVGGIVANPAV